MAQPESDRPIPLRSGLARRHDDVLVSLNEDPVPRPWGNDAGLLAVNVAVRTWKPPSGPQLDQHSGNERQSNRSGNGRCRALVTPVLVAPER